LRNGKELKFYGEIKVPILVLIGDKKEYTVLSIDDAVKLLKSENKLAEVHKIKNCNHDFEGKEKEVSKIVKKFLEYKKL